MPPDPAVPLSARSMHRRRVRIQDRNGVKVRVHEHPNGTTVEADCGCFGSPLRVHTSTYCPPFIAAQEEKSS